MNTPNQNVSYSRVMQSTLNNSEDVSRSGRQFKSQAIQTTAEGFDEYDNKRQNRIMNDTFFEKLKSCFVELLEAPVERETAQKERTVIDTALKTHFGVKGEIENHVSAISNHVDSKMVGNHPNVNESNKNSKQDKVKNAAQKEV